MFRQQIIDLRSFNDCHFLFFPLEMNHSDVFRSCKDYHTESIHHTYHGPFIIVIELDHFDITSKITLSYVGKFAAHTTNKASEIGRFV